ncbi:TRAP transporter substrate-binding protein DctP [uncultured Roseobacter sp.]|uniref:TRAP transporter substrate-binding protein DctP n=1 Tax=uncultured Roseobacter sp. TaxID=114847 RepID=UPI00262B7CF9|nr:TRAP transporter substrate-binding protein DctP [uncultured Roseobacter sp.]
MKQFVLMAGALVAGLASSSAFAQEIRAVGAFPETFVFTREIAQPFADLVAEESGGTLTVSFTGPDAVPPLEQFEPTQAGVFDMLFTHPAYHAGTTPVGLSIDAIAPDPVARREAGIIDFIDAHYQQTQGMKLLAAPPTGNVGFRYYLRDPISAEPAFDGRNIRGTVSYHPMIEALGGAGIVMGGGDVYSALQTGAIDGAAWGLTGALDFNWHEVAGYMAEPGFGQVGLMIFMNLDAWNGMSEENQAILERAALRLETETMARFDQLAADEREALLDLGMEMTEFSPDEAEQLDALWSNGVWQVGAQGAPDAIAELRSLAQNAGLSD